MVLLIDQVAASLGFLLTTRFLLNPAEAPGAWLHFAGCGVLGMATSYVFIGSTQYYTDYAFHPVRSIAEASTTGHGTNIITGTQGPSLPHSASPMPASHSPRPPPLLLLPQAWRWA